MAVRLHCRRQPVSMTIPSPRMAPRVHVPMRYRASKPMLAYQMVILPSLEALHQKLTLHSAVVVEDPYLDKKKLIPQVLIHFADKKMMQGMIKVELTLMIWSDKELKLPDEVIKLLIDNLAQSLAMSARPAQAAEHQLENSSEQSLRQSQESNIRLKLSEKPI